MTIDKVQRIESGLRGRDYKLTRPRQAVLAVIVAAEEHLTPAAVYQRAKAQYPRLGLTTVYRTLDLLVELGYVQRVHGSDGCHGYVAVSREHSHHILCADCGRTESFSGCDLEPLVQALQERTGYQIDSHILQLIGRCPECQRGKSERDGCAT